MSEGAAGKARQKAAAAKGKAAAAKRKAAAAKRQGRGDSLSGGVRKTAGHR